MASRKIRINNITSLSLMKEFIAKPISEPRVFAGAFGGKSGEIRSGFSSLPATLIEVQKIAVRFAKSATLVEIAFTKTESASISNQIAKIRPS